LYITYYDTCTKKIMSDYTWLCGFHLPTGITWLIKDSLVKALTQNVKLLNYFRCYWF